MLVFTPPPAGHRPSCGFGSTSLRHRRETFSKSLHPTRRHKATAPSATRRLFTRRCSGDAAPRPRRRTRPDSVRAMPMAQAADSGGSSGSARGVGADAPRSRVRQKTTETEKSQYTQILTTRVKIENELKTFAFIADKSVNQAAKKNIRFSIDSLIANICL